MNTRDAAWHAQRKLTIGGSECAAALGIDPFMSQRELWERKRGTIADEPDNDRMLAGRLLEPPIAQWAMQKYDVKLQQRHRRIVHPKYPFMGGFVDRVVVGAKIVVEIKTVDAYVHRYSGEWGAEETSDLPERYLLQGLHYALLLNYPLVHFFVLIGGNRLARYIARRDAELDDLIISGEHDFFQRLIYDDPPPLDHQHATTTALLNKLYPDTNGERIVLPDSALHWHLTLLEANERLKAYQAVVEGAKSHLLELIGNASIGQLCAGGEYHRKTIHRAAYPVAETSYTALTYRKPKGAKDDD
ncbi:putative phage-type endonuclease [Paraburkholderia sp. BL8N3]|nr:YqaJ viral recombinase family protein [Paraburkholderia sp. BL8N3]TCK38000.1 putative phage-type endonuclease [Paraburkholderia sp. BL8N3]